MESYPLYDRLKLISKVKNITIDISDTCNTISGACDKNSTLSENEWKDFYNEMTALLHHHNTINNIKIKGSEVAKGCKKLSVRGVMGHFSLLDDGVKFILTEYVNNPCANFDAKILRQMIECYDKTFNDVKDNYKVTNKKFIHLINKYMNTISGKNDKELEDCINYIQTKKGDIDPEIKSIIDDLRK